MVSEDRWEEAQLYERTYWDQRAAQIESGNSQPLSWYSWRSGRLVDQLRSIGMDRLTRGDIRLLEIGCGPVGIVSYFPAENAIGLDPLEGYYQSSNALVEPRNPAVSYIEGRAEEIPFPDDHFDFVIADNCIDHVKAVGAVLTEAKRVLRPGGLLYVRVNCRTPWGFLVHRLISMLRIDVGHPFTFTTERIRKLVDEQFTVVESTKGSFWESWRAELRTMRMKECAMALLGVSKFAVEVYGQK